MLLHISLDKCFRQEDVYKRQVFHCILDVTILGHSILVLSLGVYFETPFCHYAHSFAGQRLQQIACFQVTVPYIFLFTSEFFGVYVATVLEITVDFHWFTYTAFK